MYFLFKFDPRRGEMLDIMRFEQNEVDAAYQALFELENAHPDLEVVMLYASSLEQLETTHSRFFQALEYLKPPRRSRSVA
jgi:hypothetical protein